MPVPESANVSFGAPGIAAWNAFLVNMTATSLADWTVQWFGYLAVEPEVGSSIPPCASCEQSQPV